jgi:hypothetical protein
LILDLEMATKSIFKNSESVLSLLISHYLTPCPKTTVTTLPLLLPFLKSRMQFWRSWSIIAVAPTTSLRGGSKDSRFFFPIGNQGKRKQTQGERSLCPSPTNTENMQWQQLPTNCCKLSLTPISNHGYDAPRAVTLQSSAITRSKSIAVHRTSILLGTLC